MRPSFSYERSGLEKLVLAERSEAGAQRMRPMLRQAQHEDFIFFLTLSLSKGGQPVALVALDGPGKPGHDIRVWGAVGASSAP